MSAVITALVAACNSKACAPPPVGSGGSLGLSAATQEVWQSSFNARHDAGESDSPLGQAAKAVTSYCGMYFQKVNGWLRHGGGLRKEQIEDTNALIGRLDHAFEAFGSTLREPVTVYRGVVVGDEPKVVAGMDLVTPGRTVVDKGFVSTSLSLEKGEIFANKERHEKGVPGDYKTGVLMRITLPKGARVLAGTLGEKEFILPRGSKFRVTGSHRGPGAYIVTDLELVV